ncbi:hypothetical protein NDU88_007128 [Pleurodeles waltl]|uniref:Uncharacterized protein n=1 Tax=Pleurodeles waltl TaxID=8319 RepID=A0AAV7SRU3_PLEWA|nr:hypothetical protein NDU88_007128 [Pleurodeles waltl]
MHPAVPARRLPLTPAAPDFQEMAAWLRPASARPSTPVLSDGNRPSVQARSARGSPRLLLAVRAQTPARERRG